MDNIKLDSQNSTHTTHILDSNSNYRMCSGTLMDKDCQNKHYCNETSCNIKNNCRCPSSKIPGDLALEDTPQFVLFTIDD